MSASAGLSSCGRINRRTGTDETRQSHFRPVRRLPRATRNRSKKLARGVQMNAEAIARRRKWPVRTARTGAASARRPSTSSRVQADGNVSVRDGSARPCLSPAKGAARRSQGQSDFTRRKPRSIQPAVSASWAHSTWSIQRRSSLWARSACLRLCSSFSSAVANTRGPS